MCGEVEGVEEEGGEGVGGGGGGEGGGGGREGALSRNGGGKRGGGVNGHRKKRGGEKKEERLVPLQKRTAKMYSTVFLHVCPCNVCVCLSNVCVCVWVCAYVHIIRTNTFALKVLIQLGVLNGHEM